MTLIAWRMNRKLGIAFAFFLVLIFLGSIHLAWHYAVDGIAGMSLAIVFWSIAGVIARATTRHISKYRAAVNDVIPEASHA
jgi:hypothetical protein